RRPLPLRRQRRHLHLAAADAPGAHVAPELHGAGRRQHDRRDPGLRAGTRALPARRQRGHPERVRHRECCGDPRADEPDRGAGAAVTQRSAFVLRVRPECVDEYVEAHREVWPEMLEALKGAGIRNYTIFRAGSEMFGYFEADDLDAAERYLSQQEICTRWQDAMARLLEERVPDGGPPPLLEVFRLE